MIPIAKGEPPEVLKRRSAAAADALCKLYDEDRASFDEGSQRFNFNANLYGHDSVRAALHATHHGKCAFCEVKIPKPYADAHVEHWRPKGAVKQVRGDEDLFPGYYWLAYEWDNLLLACLFCNRDNKRTLFPLVEPASRARNHHGSTAAEAPLLLKPDDGSDPREDIEFVEEQPRGLSERGWRTIEALGLDRLEHKPRDDLLVELQLAYDQVWKHHGDLHEAAQTLVAQGRALYEEAPKPTSPFSAMAACFVAANPLPPVA